MVAGHLQQKKGYWYIVLNLHDETGKRRSKWIATHLPVRGNKRRAEEMLLQARQQHTDLYHRTGPASLLFSDYPKGTRRKIQQECSIKALLLYKLQFNFCVDNCLYLRTQRTAP